MTIYDDTGAPCDLPAFTSAAPGLVVHFSNGDPGWVVTHERSGLMLSGFDNPEQAQAAAGDFADLADWTASGETITSDRHLSAKVRAIRDKWGGDIWSANENPAAYVDRLSV